jgi:hypothetical protein
VAGKGLTVTGGAETARAFDQLADDVANMGPVHERIARARLPGVARRTPRRTGALAGSWYPSGDKSGGGILSPLDYAGVIEYGAPGRSIAPVGMIAATLEAEADQIAAEYEEAIRERAKARGFRVE